MGQAVGTLMQSASQVNTRSMRMRDALEKELRYWDAQLSNLAEDYQLDDGVYDRSFYEICVEHHNRIFYALHYDTDKCRMPYCPRMGVAGNENIVDGVVMCDDCHSRQMRDKNAGTPHQNRSG